MDSTPRGVAKSHFWAIIAVGRKMCQAWKWDFYDSMDKCKSSRRLRHMRRMCNIHTHTHTPFRLPQKVIVHYSRMLQIEHTCLASISHQQLVVTTCRIYPHFPLPTPIVNCNLPTLQFWPLQQLQLATLRQTAIMQAHSIQWHLLTPHPLLTAFVGK